MKKRWILCTVAVLCIAAALLGCGKKNVNTVSTKEDALVEETEESEKIEQETEIVQTENEEKKKFRNICIIFQRN